MFDLPQFPLTADIYSMFVGYDFNDRFFRATVSCQLRGFGPALKVGWSAQFKLFTEHYAGWALLLPPLTDIRDASCNGFSDVVEVPSASGRWYVVMYVDDVAKGFANEYRTANLVKMGPDAIPTAVNFPYWPTPIP